MWFQAACLVLASALQSGHSERYVSAGVVDQKTPDQQKSESMKLFMSGQDIICGGPEIWNMLTSGSDASSVENIKWAKIKKIAEDHLQGLSDSMKVLELELKSLEERIQVAKLAEQVKVVDEVMAEELIVSALDIFGGHEQARLTKCGKPTAHPRAKREAYRQSQADFSLKAEQYFKGGTVRLDGDVFLEKCRAILFTKDSYCEPLCQKFKDKAQEFSDAEAGEASTGSDVLVKQQVQTAEKLRTAMSDMTMCKKAQLGLEGFKTQLLKLKTGMNQRFEELQDAEYALDDAQFELVDFVKGLEADEERLSAAEGALTTATSGVADAQSTLEAAKQKEKTLQMSVLRLSQRMDNLRLTLQVIKNIDKVVSRLKMAVSLTMEGMQGLREKAVLDPLRQLGFREDFPLDESFPKDPSVLKSAKTLGGQVSYLRNFCDGEAKAAFAQVKQIVDLDPLCEFGTAEDTTIELNEAVQDQMEALKERITQGVLSEFNPYKSNRGMTVAQSAKNVQAGELRGLQEIMGPFSRTEFYKSYLKSWKLKGPFLQRIAKLTKAIAHLDASLQALTEELQGFDREYTEAQNARKRAADALELASKEQNLASSVRQNLEEQVRALREEGVELGQELDQLRAAVAQAKERYLAAREKLVIAHQEGTSLLEAQEPGLRGSLPLHDISLH